MNFSLENIKNILEICSPIVAIGGWFIRLEVKHGQNEIRLQELTDMIAGTSSQNAEDKKLIQKMAVDIAEIKTNMEWVKKLAK